MPETRDNDDDRPTDPAPSPAKPPLLDYPSPPELETESWSEVLRAMGIVFGTMAFLFAIGFGVCGVLFRGCR